MHIRQFKVLITFSVVVFFMLGGFVINYYLFTEDAQSDVAIRDILGIVLPNGSFGPTDKIMGGFNADEARYTVDDKGVIRFYFRQYKIKYNPDNPLHKEFVKRMFIKIVRSKDPNKNVKLVPTKVKVTWRGEAIKRVKE